MKTLLISALLLAITFPETKQGGAEKRLLKKLFSNYKRLERPVKDDRETLQVIFGVTLQQIVDVDEKAQVIRSNIWLDLQWHECRFAWNPEEFGNMTVINLPIKEIWRPDILLYSSADHAFEPTYPANAVVQSDGTVNWIPPGMYTSACNIGIRWFPFDDQSCKLKFRSWSYDAYSLNLTLKNTTGDISSYIKNGEWELLGMPALRQDGIYGPSQRRWVTIYFSINIRRLPRYYAFNLIVPSVIFSSIAVLTFTLPVESGEKITYGVTILLSLTVFLLLVAEELPPTGDVVPLIGIYFACTMTLISLSVCMTVLVLNFHSRRPETHEMPMWMKRGVCQWLAWVLRMERPGHDLTRKGLFSLAKQMQLKEHTSKSLLANVTDMDDDIHDTLTDFQRRFRHSSYASQPDNLGGEQAKYFTEAKSELAAILREVRIITQKLREIEEKDEAASDWQFASMVVDRLCLYVFVLATLVSTSAILLSAPNVLKFEDPSQDVTS